MGCAGIDISVTTAGVSPMETMELMVADEKKARELILYICEKCVNYQYFGMTKLNKILFFSDFLTYLRTGKPITCLAYQKLRFGPAPVRMLPITEEMKTEALLVIQEARVGTKTQHRPVNTRVANLEKFTADEISIVDEMIEFFSEKSAGETSEISHQILAYQIAREGDIIPYSAVFITNEPPSDKEFEEMARLNAEYGWVN